VNARATPNSVGSDHIFHCAPTQILNFPVSHDKLWRSAENTPHNGGDRGRARGPQRLRPFPTRNPSPLPGLIFIIIFVAGLGLAYANMSPESPAASVSIVVLSFTVAAIVANAVKVADQWERVVVRQVPQLEGPRLFFIVPIIEAVPYRIDTRVITSTFRAEQTMTRYTVPVDVDAVLFWKVVDPKMAALDVAAMARRSTGRRRRRCAT
jgi:hypothetical protein